MSATVHAVVQADGSAALEVIATVRNYNDQSIQVLTAPECPIYVKLWPNPNGGQYGSTWNFAVCATAHSVDLAPGDSLVLSTVVPAQSLASFAPGEYAVNAAVAGPKFITSVWAGNVDLPL